MRHIFAAYFRKYFVGGIVFGFLSGCSVLDPAEDVPSYIHIGSMSLSTIGGQGSSTAEITDAWIFMDGNLIGAFQLPCTVPILAEGNHNFVIRGGVKENGLSSERAIYPSWKGWEGTLTLTRGQKVSIDPVITYFPAQDFINTFMEDFDAVGTGLTADADSRGRIALDSDAYAFEGRHSGHIHLNNTDTTFFVGSSVNAYLLPSSHEAWVEFNYWSDAPFTCGVVDANNSASRVPWVTVGPNWKWGKIYIRLNDGLLGDQSIHYKIYFAMLNTGFQTDMNLYLDNIKLLK
jgi:hypothetical protein